MSLPVLPTFPSTKMTPRHAAAIAWRGWPQVGPRFGRKYVLHSLGRVCARSLLDMYWKSFHDLPRSAKCVSLKSGLRRITKEGLATKGCRKQNARTPRKSWAKARRSHMTRGRALGNLGKHVSRKASNHLRRRLVS